ncbi:hypothetical protein [Paenibacillus chitinolyticus]|uniref:hypothetical protein n=1 Tax=Paenibacillus chitinolyticus TaxID=79263 RepID=UPI00366AA856
MNWLDEYPHEVYASVLLLDGKIYNWKVGNYFWSHPMEAKIRMSDFDKFDRMEVKHTSFTVNNDFEHNLAFSLNAKQWYRQWEISEEHVGSAP